MPKKKTTSNKKKVTKKAVKKTANKATKKVAKKKPAAKKKAAVAKKATKKAPKKAKKVAAKTSTKKTSTQKKSASASTKVASAASKDNGHDPKATPIVFSLDDVEQLMAAKKKNESKNGKKEAKEAAPKAPAPAPKKKVVVEDAPVEQRVLGAASLADILGYNPAEKNKKTDLSEEEIPKKWQKYYKLLIELRKHVTDEIDLHTADTLKHSSRDDSGDLSSYGSHQADAGTDTFDRDFALSLVSSEQEALNEIEEAILRIKDGTYGTCEVTGKAIPAARLTAVPFARFSVEGQAEYEKNIRRKVDRSVNAGLFGDGTDAPKIASSDDDD